MAEQSAAASMMADLDRLTVPELTRLRDAAETKRREKLGAAKEAVLEETRAKLAELGLTLEAVMPAATNSAPTRKPRRDTGAPLATKYRGPNGEAWSGRGRKPRWLQTLEAEGKNREEFRV